MTKEELVRLVDKISFGDLGYRTTVEVKDSTMKNHIGKVCIKVLVPGGSGGLDALPYPTIRSGLAIEIPGVKMMNEFHVLLLITKGVKTCWETIAAPRMKIDGQPINDYLHKDKHNESQTNSSQ